jgi:hypothetical protein
MGIKHSKWYSTVRNFAALDMIGGKVQPQRSVSTVKANIYAVMGPRSGYIAPTSTYSHKYVPATLMYLPFGAS